MNVDPKISAEPKMAKIHLRGNLIVLRSHNNHVYGSKPLRPPFQVKLSALDEIVMNVKPAYSPYVR